VAEAIGRGAAGLEGASFDVAIVGGGMAGIAAGLAASERGARTLLIERAAALGGNATAAFVHTICGLYENGAATPRAVNPGLAERFAQGLAAAGGAGQPERAGKVWVLPTDPPAIESYAASLCEASRNLTTRLDCQLSAARLGLETDAASRLQVEGEGSEDRVELDVSVVVDASGDGVLGEFGAADAARVGDGEIQLPSYIARIAGVPSGEAEGYGRLRLTVAVASAARRQLLPTGCESVLLRPAAKAGEAYLTLNVSREELAAARDPDLVATRQKIEQRARGHVEAIVEHLRATRPGYSECRVVAWPRRLGVREGARLLGLESLDATAVLEGRRREDEVAVSSWPIELWQSHRGASFRHPKAPCSIPLGALISRSHPRLGMAGRCISASHEALGALRVLGTALATGEAIGIAAALAAERGCGLAEIKAGEVRRVRDS
jgi:hypothetical protein